MEELGHYLREKTGWSLNPSELSRLCSRYLNAQTRVIDYPRLLEDIRKGVLLKEKSNFLDDSVLSKQNRHMSCDQILEVLRQRINHCSECLRGEDKLKKAYLLLSESRSSTVTRQQLKIACQSRLSLFLNDSEIEEIFRQYDTQCEGKVNIRQLINAILKRDRDSMALSLQIGDNNPGNTLKNSTSAAATSTASTPNTYASTPSFANTSSPRGGRSEPVQDNQNASITYDRQIKGLIPPNPNQCKEYSIQDIEDFIWDRVFERSSLSENMVKTLTRLFSSGEHIAGNHVVTCDQLKYTLWKRLKLNITEQDVEKFFMKYMRSPGNRSREGIDMFQFTDGIIRQRAKNQTIIGDNSDKANNAGGSSSSAGNTIMGNGGKLISTVQKKRSVEQFLVLLRQQINDLINRESRAPHYLLYGNTRMTKDQTKQFLLSKLRLSLDGLPKHVVDDIFVEYDLHGLIDTKRMIMDAMAMKEDQIPRQAGEEDAVGKLPNQTLLNGASVSVDKMPSSLNRSALTPDMIEELLVKKCMERLKDDHPHASLHRVFRDAGEADARYITRKGMKSVLHRFDMIMSNEEFDAFFSKHDRTGNGKIDVHSFLRTILPPLDLDQNPFLPKDQHVVKKEVTLAQVVEEMTGRRREVSNLNGPSYTRVESDFMQELQGKKKPSSAATGNNSNNKPGITLGYNSNVNSASAPTTPAYSQHATSSPNLQSNFYAGSFNLAQTQIHPSQGHPAMSQAEQLQLAESLLHAMRDLPYLTQQSPATADSAPSSQPAPAAAIAPFSPQPPSKRPSTAPAHRVTHSAQTAVSTPASTSENYAVPQPPATTTATSNNNSNKNSNQQEKHSSHKSRPKSASATYRTSTATTDGKSTALSAEDEYRLMQSQHLLALAQAYAQFTHEQINGNDAKGNNQYDIPSVAAKRPSSAPPSRGAHQLPFKHMKVPGRDTATPNSTFGQSPRFVTPDTPRSTASASSPRPVKFVNTGQHRNVPVSPYENNLQKLYQYTHRNIATTHEEYGLFVKNLSKAAKMRQKITEKQKDLRMTLGQTA